MIELPGDSEDYHLLTQGVELSKDVSGLTCELGLRRGGGTKYIIDALSVYSHLKTHLAVDPYGHIPYEHKEGEIVQLDYTNDMYNDCMTNVFEYAKEKKIAFLFFKLEDTEFFERFSDGVPIYNVNKSIENVYSFVHFDGPHAVAPLITEIDFFDKRMNPGATAVFDDIEQYYNHDEVEQYLFKKGWVLINKTKRKGLYQKK